MSDLRLTEERLLRHFPATKRHIVRGAFYFRTLKAQSKPAKVVENVFSDWNRRSFHAGNCEEGELYADFRKILTDHRDEAEAYAAQMLARKRGK